MAWSVGFHEEFEPEFWELKVEVRREIFALTKVSRRKARISDVPTRIR